MATVTPPVIHNDLTKLNLGTLNMQDGRAGKMHFAAKSFHNHQIDICVLTETKMQNNFSQIIDGYQFVHCIGHSQYSGGVSLAYRLDDSRYSVESVKCETNIVSFQLVTPQHRFNVVGLYIQPGNPTATEMVGDKVSRILRQHPHLPRIILGDLNANPHRQPLRPWDAIMAANWAEWGIEDLGSHFYTKRGTRFATWHQRVQGHTRTALCDFVLTDKRSSFRRLRAVEPRYYHSDHRFVIATMNLSPTQDFHRHLKGRKKAPHIPLPPPDAQLDPLLDACLANKQPIQVDHQVVDKTTWVSDTLLNLYKTRSQLRKRRPTRLRRRQLRQLKNQIKRQVRQDRLQHAKRACDNILVSLGTQDCDSAWGWCKAWYKEATLHAPRPSPHDLEEIHTLFSERYAADGVDREPFPVHAPTFAIDDSPPSEGEIATAVGRLKNRKAPGHFGTRAEHLKTWMRNASTLRREQPNTPLPDDHPWLVFIAFVREVFSTGRTPARLGVAELVILPKPGGGVRGIGLLEPLWKVISSIIDFRIKTTVQWDSNLHGFLPNRSTGTAIADTKLRSDLATAQNLPYHRIYIDLTKAYDCVDRTILLQLLEAYGVGPRIRSVLQTQWTAQQFITKQSGFYGPIVPTSRGVTQGDIVSPTLFNIAIDAVSREWKHQLNIGPNSDPLELDAGFYADDSIIGGIDANRVQEGLNCFVSSMHKVGLAVNVSKTESQTHFPGGIHHSWNSPAYEHRITGVGLSPRTRRQQEVECPICHLTMVASSLQRHLESQHQQFAAPRPTARRSLFNSETYSVNMPSRGEYHACPVPNCPGGSRSRSDLRKHFRTRHPLSTVDFAHQLPRVPCPNCGKSVAQTQLNRHTQSSECQAHQRRTTRLQGIQRSLTAANTRFHIGDTQLEEAKVFKYLGKPTPPYCTDITAMYYNIAKARRKWTMLRRILAAQHLPPTIASIFYKAVVQAVLLYGSETWVITKRALTLLDSFHHRIARQITGQHVYQGPQGTWIYPDPKETLEKAGLFPMRTYLLRRRNYLQPYLANHPVTLLGQQHPRDGNNCTQKFLWQNVEDDLLFAEEIDTPDDTPED